MMIVRVKYSGGEFTLSYIILMAMFGYVPYINKFWRKYKGQEPTRD